MTGDTGTGTFTGMKTSPEPGEERLRYLASLIDNVSDAIFSIDKERIITFWNKRAQEIYGWTSEEAVGQNAALLLKSQVGESERNKWLRNAEKFGELLVETVHYTKFNKKIVVESHLLPVKNQAGEITGYTTVNRDITERKKSEEALKRSEENFRTLADNISQFAWMTDEKGWIFWYNKRWYDYTGTTFDEMQGWGWQKVHHPEHIERVMENWTKALARGETWEDTFPLKGKNGTYRWFLSRALPIRDENGNITRWFGTNTDITESKLQELELRQTLEELKRSNGELEQFAYVASHDLQEPLRMVSAYTRLLEGQLRDKLDEKTLKYMYFVTDGAKRMHALIQDLLAFSRVASPNETIIKTDLNALLAEIMRDFQVAITDHNAELEIAEMPVLYVDPTQMKLVLQNLIQNAIKFRSAENPLIQVKAERKENEWLFSVRDNGIGIDPEFHDRIFVIFQRLHEKEKYPGTGIGLSICRKIVERHGGRIWVDSKLGEGSTFYFTVPDGK